MTIREVFEAYGIHAQAELRQRTGLSKQYVSMLWNDQLNVGPTLGARLAQQLGIPLGVILAVDRRPRRRSTRPPGRPRKPLAEGWSEA
jgi:transcriptional regulator with XRE-family HTH domain